MKGIICIARRDCTPGEPIHEELFTALTDNWTMYQSEWVIDVVFASLCFASQCYAFSHALGAGMNGLVSAALVSIAFAGPHTNWFGVVVIVAAAGLVELSSRR